MAQQNKQSTEGRAGSKESARLFISKNHEGRKHEPKKQTATAFDRLNRYKPDRKKQNSVMKGGDSECRMLILKQ